MTDTTLQNPVPAVPPAVPVPTHAAPKAAFTDGDSASRWAKTLPLLPVGQAYDALIGQLALLAAADTPPRERARIAEILRDQVSHLHTELARRYAGKAQPEGEREREAIDQAVALWRALWEQYSACLKPLLEGDPDLAGVKAKIIQRGIFVGKELILVHGLARRATTPSFSRSRAYGKNLRLHCPSQRSASSICRTVIAQGSARPSRSAWL